MRRLALAFALALLAASCSRATTAPAAGAAAPAGAPEVRLEAVDTSDMTARERGEWSRLVTTLLAPCADQAVPIAQCVAEQRACAAMNFK